MVIAKMVHIQTTTACTLKCKKCGWMYPHFNSVENEDCDTILNSLPVLFNLCDRVKELRVAGAEAWLYPEVEKLLIGAARFSSQFDVMLIITNGTFLPKQSIFETMKNLPCNFLVRIDDYGDLSCQKANLMEKLSESEIPYEVRCYSKEEQFSGGWVDFGDLEYYDTAGYKTQNEKFGVCACNAITNEYTLWGGRLYGCARSAIGNALGKFAVPTSDYIDLLSDELIETKREHLQTLAKGPYYACSYCLGRDNKNLRIDAAEQL